MARAVLWLVEGLFSLRRVYPVEPEADTAERWPQGSHLPSFLVHA